MIAWIFPGQCIKWMFVKEVDGRRNFPEGNFIFAANHLSHIDWLIGWRDSDAAAFTFIGQVDKMTGIKRISARFDLLVGRSDPSQPQ